MRVLMMLSAGYKGGVVSSMKVNLLYRGDSHFQHGVGAWTPLKGG